MAPDMIAGGPKATTDEMTNAEALGLCFTRIMFSFFKPLGPFYSSPWLGDCSDLTKT